MNTTSRKKEKKTNKRRTHPYASLLKEVRAAWNKNPKVVKNMLRDMVEKRSMLLDRPFLMEFVERFLRRYKGKISDDNYELWQEVLQWTIRQRVQYLVDVYNWFRIQDYHDKYWATQELKLNFLNKRIEAFSRSLTIKVGKGSYQQTKVEMIKLLQKGTYPDSKKYDPYHIGRLLAVLQYLEFLKSEKRKLVTPQAGTAIEVPLELKKDQETTIGQFVVTIPSGLYEYFKQGEALGAEMSSESPAPEEDARRKLYTRSEAAELMQISLPTLDQMTKQGEIKCHRIKGKNMKRYKWEDIQQALVEIEARYVARGK